MAYTNSLSNSLYVVSSAAHTATFAADSTGVRVTQRWRCSFQPNGRSVQQELHCQLSIRLLRCVLKCDSLVLVGVVYDLESLHCASRLYLNHSSLPRAFQSAKVGDPAACQSQTATLRRHRERELASILDMRTLGGQRLQPLFLQGLCIRMLLHISSRGLLLRLVLEPQCSAAARARSNSHLMRVDSILLRVCAFCPSNKLPWLSMEITA